MQLCNEMRESWTLCLVGVMISEISGRFWSQSKQRYLCLEQNRQILRFDMFGNAPDTKSSQKFVQTGAKTVFEHENLTYVYPCARFPDTWAHISTLTAVAFSWKLEASQQCEEGQTQLGFSSMKLTLRSYRHQWETVRSSQVIWSDNCWRFLLYVL